MNFWYQNNKKEKKNDKTQNVPNPDLNRTINNENNFQNKFLKLNIEKMKLERSYQSLDIHRKLNSKRRVTLASQVCLKFNDFFKNFKN